jgi:hypothetical protein
MFALRKDKIMTLNDFKHWLDGFSESIHGSPTKEQLENIKEKLDKITSAYLPYPAGAHPEQVPLWKITSPHNP